MRPFGIADCPAVVNAFDLLKRRLGAYSIRVFGTQEVRAAKAFISKSSWRYENCIIRCRIVALIVDSRRPHQLPAYSYTEQGLLSAAKIAQHLAANTVDEALCLRARSRGFSAKEGLILRFFNDSPSAVVRKNCEPFITWNILESRRTDYVVRQQLPPVRWEIAQPICRSV